VCPLYRQSYVRQAFFMDMGMWIVLLELSGDRSIPSLSSVFTTFSLHSKQSTWTRLSCWH
jgi:hypothetical protein